MDSAPDSLGRSSKRLADLISATEGPQGDWQHEELGSILRHQMQSRVEFELSEAGVMPEAGLEELRGVHSFDDLFHSSAPPLRLLQMTKEFAKAHLSHPDTTLVKEVASVLYYASIALALTRHRTRITQLGDTELSQGLEWCLGQPWMEPELRRVLAEGLSCLHQGP
jgi:hypothetical protein